MTLTEEMVSLSLRVEIDTGPDPKREPLNDAQVDELAYRLDRESHGWKLWVFAYGSLIWKLDLEGQGQGLASFLLPQTDTRSGNSDPAGTDAGHGMLLPISGNGLKLLRNICAVSRANSVVCYSVSL